MWLNDRWIPTELVHLMPSLTIAGSDWEGHCGLPLERRWLPALSVRAGHVLFDGLGAKTFGDLLELNVVKILSVRNAGTKTVKEILALRDEIFSRGPAEYEKEKADVESSETTRLPPTEIARLSVRAQHFLRDNGIETYAQLFALTPNEILKAKGAGAKTARELMDFARRCGAEEKRPVLPAAVEPIEPRDFASFAEYVASVAERYFDLSGPWGVVLRDYLALGPGSVKQTLERVGQTLGVSRERVRQMAVKIERKLFSHGAEALFAAFAAEVSARFEAAGWVLPTAELTGDVNTAFGWTGTTLDNVVSLIKELGRNIEVNEYGWCGLDLEQHRVVLPVPIPTGELKRQALIRVLQAAGPQGLDPEEILSRCRVVEPGIAWTIGMIRGAMNRGHDLDQNGTRLIGYDRGARTGELTRYTLNTFFRDRRTAAVLNRAAQEIGDYMRATGFGVVSVWKWWQKYRAELPLDLPKLGFYMMMRDLSAGGLVYREYPRISMPGIDVCENVYGWELYQYFLYCGKREAMFGQIMSFFVDCLGLQPSIAFNCAFHSMGLKKVEDELMAPYALRRPTRPVKTPRVLLGTVKRDPSLSLIKSSDKFTIHSDYFDDEGHALNHTTYVRMLMRSLEKAHFGFPASELARLLDPGWCKVHLKTARAILAQFPGYPPRGNGYWKEKFTFGGEVYFVCDDWNQRNKVLFDQWAARMAGMAGVEFTPYEVKGLAALAEE